MTFAIRFDTIKLAKSDAISVCGKRKRTFNKIIYKKTHVFKYKLQKSFAILDAVN